MSSVAETREVTQPTSAQVPWPTLPSGQAMPFMSLSMSAFLLGMHVIHGVLGSFQLPGFIETLSKDRPNGQGDRLFTLPPNVINVENIKKFTPRKRHLKPKKLFRQLGSDFDSFWMSADVPDDLMETHVKEKLDTSLFEHLESANLTSLEHAILAKYSNENGSGDAGGYDVSGSGTNNNSDLTNGILDVVKFWLVQKASCPIYFIWDDLGLLYWPRWVRRGMCSLKSTPLSKLTSESASKTPKFPPCSWPPGMHCVPANPKQLKILRWQCRNNKAMNNFNRFQLPGMKKLRSLNRNHRRGKKKLRSINSNQYFSKRLQEEHNGQQPTTPISIEKKERTKRDNLQPDLQELIKIANSQRSDDERGINIKTKSAHAGTFRGADQDKINNEADVKEQGDGADRKKQDEVDGNDTENWNSVTWKQRRRKLDLKCKWIKIPYPVTDECFCSC